MGSMEAGVEQSLAKMATAVNENVQTLLLRQQKDTVILLTQTFNLQRDLC